MSAPNHTVSTRSLIHCAEDKDTLPSPRRTISCRLKMKRVVLYVNVSLFLVQLSLLIRNVERSILLVAFWKTGSRVVKFLDHALSYRSFCEVCVFIA